LTLLRKLCRAARKPSGASVEEQHVRRFVRLDRRDQGRNGFDGIAWVPWTVSCSLRRLPAVSASSAIGSADWVSERPAKSVRNPPGSTTIAFRPD